MAETAGCQDKTGPAARHSFAGKGVTDASGNVTFNFVTPFPTVPVVTIGSEGNVNVSEARITALTVNSCTINVRGSAVIVILGINVLGAPAPIAGVTVHIAAQEAGRVTP